MIITMIKVILQIIANRNKNVTIYFFTEEEIEKLNLSDLEEKEDFPIYMGDEQI